VTGMTRLRTAFFRRGGGFFEIKQIVGSVALGRLFRLAAKDLVLQGVDLAVRLIKLLLQLLDTLDGLSMLVFPITNFPAEIAPQLLQYPL
jgi:hypothetical protein